eukprot:2166975-Rhodomonas_salina.2
MQTHRDVGPERLSQIVCTAPDCTYGKAIESNMRFVPAQSGSYGLVQSRLSTNSAHALSSTTGTAVFFSAPPCTGQDRPRAEMISGYSCDVQRPIPTLDMRVPGGRPKQGGPCAESRSKTSACALVLTAFRVWCHAIGGTEMGCAAMR